MTVEISSESNAWISPFDSLVQSPPPGGERHKGGPLWEDWDNTIQQRHCLNRKPIDAQPADIPLSKDFEKIPSGLWCGPITRHFGHQVAEFGTRLPVYLGKHSRENKLIFGLMRDANVNSLPTFMKQILAWFNIPNDHIIYCNSPLLVSQLMWAPQQEQLADVPPSPEYLDILSRNAAINLDYPAGNNKRIYVSRAGQQRGIIAGEAYIEDFLNTRGYIVIRPENHTLREQLTLYQNASELIFSEGSALHALQLLGHLHCRIMVLVRRPNRRFIQRILSSRTPEVRYVDNISLFMPGLSSDGKSWQPTGISILDSLAIREAFESFGIPCSTWDHSEFRRCIAVSARNWLSKLHSRYASAYPREIMGLEAQLLPYL